MVKSNLGSYKEDLRGTNVNRDTCSFFVLFFLLSAPKGTCWPFELEQQGTTNAPSFPSFLYGSRTRYRRPSWRTRELSYNCFSSTLPCSQCAIFDKSDSSDFESLRSLVTLQSLWIKVMLTWISVGQCHKFVMQRYYYVTLLTWSKHLYTLQLPTRVR